MKRVTGIGGVFFKSKDPKKLKTWYTKHLGMKSEEFGSVFAWRDHNDKEKTCYTIWSPMDEKLGANPSNV